MSVKLLKLIFFLKMYLKEPLIMRLGKILTILIIVEIIFFGCGNKKEINVIKIGAVLPLTGSIAQYGKYMSQGLELALEDAINQDKISKNRIELIIEDAQADPRKSVDVFQKLINIDGVVACIPATSGVTLAMKPIANNNQVVLINASAISTQIEDADDYVFSVLPDAGYEGKFLAEVAFNKLGKRNAGIIFRNDQSGLSFQKYFSERFMELGGNILYVEGHTPNTTDFRPYITKIRNFDLMDIIFVASWGPEVATYAKQAKELGVQKQIITYETFNSPKVIEIAGETANGVIFCAPKFDENSEEPLIMQFKEKVYKKYNQNEVNYYIAAHYDAMMLLIDAIDKGNFAGEEIRNYISVLEEYYGITGKMNFNEYGAVSMDLGIYTVKDKNFVSIE
jgi:branched-chain amino acid transport system substrate-binding protein